MQVVYSFPLITKKGTILVQLGQCFRPNLTTKKIFSFSSAHGYATWVLAVSQSVQLEFREAYDVAVGLVELDAGEVA